jgi:hypothetical protein
MAARCHGAERAAGSARGFRRPPRTGTSSKYFGSSASFSLTVACSCARARVCVCVIVRLYACVCERVRACACVCGRVTACLDLLHLLLERGGPVADLRHHVDEPIGRRTMYI